MLTTANTFAELQYIVQSRAELTYVFHTIKVQKCYTCNSNWPNTAFRLPVDSDPPTTLMSSAMNSEGRDMQGVEKPLVIDERNILFCN